MLALSSQSWRCFWLGCKGLCACCTRAVWWSRHFINRFSLWKRRAPETEMVAAKAIWRKNEIGQVPGTKVRCGSACSCRETCKANMSMTKHLCFLHKREDMLICFYDLQTCEMFWELRKRALECAFKARLCVLLGISFMPIFPDFNFN